MNKISQIKHNFLERLDLLDTTEATYPLRMNALRSIGALGILLGLSLIITNCTLHHQAKHIANVFQGIVAVAYSIVIKELLHKEVEKEILMEDASEDDINLTKQEIEQARKNETSSQESDAKEGNLQGESLNQDLLDACRKELETEQEKENNKHREMVERSYFRQLREHDAKNIEQEALVEKGKTDAVVLDILTDALETLSQEHPNTQMERELLERKRARLDQRKLFLTNRIEKERENEVRFLQIQEKRASLQREITGLRKQQEEEMVRIKQQQEVLQTELRKLDSVQQNEEKNRLALQKKVGHLEYQIEIATAKKKELEELCLLQEEKERQESETKLREAKRAQALKELATKVTDNKTKRQELKEAIEKTKVTDVESFTLWLKKEAQFLTLDTKIKHAEKGEKHPEFKPWGNEEMESAEIAKEAWVGRMHSFGSKKVRKKRKRAEIVSTNGSVVTQSNEALQEVQKKLERLQSKCRTRTQALVKTENSLEAMRAQQRALQADVETRGSYVPTHAAKIKALEAQLAEIA